VIAKGPTVTAVVVLLFTALTLGMTYPLGARLTDHVPENPGDSLLIVWILAWVVHALSTPLSLFDANILYPVARTLAFSEHMLAVAPFFALPYALTGNPVLAMNVTVLLSFVLCGVTMVAFARHLTGSVTTGIVAGIVYAFAPVRLSQMGHAQLLHLYWTPLVLLFLERFLGERRRRDLAGLAACFALQCLASVYLAYISATAVGAYAIVRIALDREARRARTLGPLCAATLAAGAVVAVVNLPYFEVARTWGPPWPTRVSIEFSAAPVDYFTAGWFRSLLGVRGSSVATWEKVVSLGVVGTSLLLAGLGLGLRGGDALLARRIGSLAAIGVVAIVLSLGPRLVLNDTDTRITLPFKWLREVVPGFGMLRVPARFGFAVSLAGAAMAGIAADRIARLLEARSGWLRSSVRPLIALGLAAAFVGEVWRGPAVLAPVETGRAIPEVYRWLAAHPEDGPIGEVPRGLWEDYRYEYLSTVHWRPS
jgi:hypothetical protein